MANHRRKPCPVGCTCKRHGPHPCKLGCTCSRHLKTRKKCDAGCTCGRHRVQRCDPGCTCSRHRPAWNRYTEEQRAKALDRKRAKNAAYMLQRRLVDPERARREGREQYKRNGRKHNLRWKFGISPGQLAAIRSRQNGCCYLCEESLEQRNVHIDHDRSCCPGDRSCGLCIRGVACQLCNQGIGQFGDDPARMRRVADNLERANAKVRTDKAQLQLAINPQPEPIPSRQ